ncbi:hypothetical protein GGX14DRAFT_394710 [Mycena pura]|uniref:Uncharacterized protein n=1 Tax=Mycena pura TaxID=153505 RepID=A0AAD6VID7_9AGAR|nr:hypothetical protein GGX14DRAFT_394710 [Mycena pura]
MASLASSLMVSCLSVLRWPMAEEGRHCQLAGSWSRPSGQIHGTAGYQPPISPFPVVGANGPSPIPADVAASWVDSWVENVKVSTMRRRAGRNGQCGSANGGAQKEEGGIHHGRLDMKKARTKAECFDLAKVLQALEGADRMTRQGKLEKGQDSKAQGTGRDLGRRRARSRTTNNQPPESQVRTAGAKIWLTSGYPLVTSWHVQLNDPAGGRVQHSPTPGGAFGGYRLATRLESTPRPVGGVEQKILSGTKKV